MVMWKKTREDKTARKMPDANKTEAVARKIVLVADKMMRDPSAFCKTVTMRAKLPLQQLWWLAPSTSTCGVGVLNLIQVVAGQEKISPLLVPKAYIAYTLCQCRCIFTWPS